MSLSKLKKKQFLYISREILLLAVCILLGSIFVARTGKTGINTETSAIFIVVFLILLVLYDQVQRFPFNFEVSKCLSTKIVSTFSWFSDSDPIDIISNFQYSKINQPILGQVFHLKWPLLQKDYAIVEWHLFLERCAQNYPYSLVWIGAGYLKAMSDTNGVKLLANRDTALMPSNKAVNILSNTEVEDCRIFFSNKPYDECLVAKKTYPVDSDILFTVKDVCAQFCITSESFQLYRIVHFINRSARNI